MSSMPKQGVLFVAIVGPVIAAAIAFVSMGAGGQPEPPDAPAMPALRDASGASRPLAATVAGTQREAAPGEPLGFFGAPAGRIVRHTFAMATEVTLSERAGTQAAMAVDVTGELTTTILARQGDELVVELSLPSLRGTSTANGVRAAIEPEGEFAGGLGRPTLVRMTSAGETRGYRFDASMTASQCNFVRGLWSALRFVPRELPSWAAAERDASGVGDVAYRWLAGDGTPFAGVLHKQLKGYAAPAGGDYGRASGTGEGEADFDRTLGWFRALQWREDVRKNLDEVGVAVRAATRVRVDLVDCGWRAVATESVWDVAWQGTSAAGSEEAQRRELARQRDRLAGTSLEQMIADLGALAARGELDGHEAARLHADLKWLLRVRPEALAGLQLLLPALDSQLAGAVVAAIGATQLPAAQEMLGALFADASQATALRTSAAIAMVQVQDPSAAVVDRFLAAARDDRDDGRDGVLGAGWLAIGTMAGRARGALGERALAGLVALESRALALGGVAAWLEALGNSGADAALAAALRYRGHESVAIRVAAVSAVRTVRGADAWQFAAAALQDPEAAVRMRAIEVLAARAESGALASLVAHVGVEVESRVRLVVVAALAVRVDESSVRALLQSMSVADAEPRVRERAAAALASR